MFKLSLRYKTFRESDSMEVLIEHPMLHLTFVHVVSGKVNDQPFLVLGCVTSMLIHTRTWNYAKFTKYTKTRSLYATGVLEIEQGTFTPLVSTTTGGIGKECVRYHTRLAELVAIKIGEDYAITMGWIRARISFA